MFLHLALCHSLMWKTPALWLQAAVIGNIIGRMVSPGSERHTLDWLRTHSALGELLDHDFETTSLTRLYTTTDKLLAQQSQIEQFLYQRECHLFELTQTIVLYDLTNTFFEGKNRNNRTGT